MKTSKIGRWRRHAVVVPVSLLLLFVLVTLPFTAWSVVEDIFSSPESEDFVVPAGAPGAPSPTSSHIHLGLENLNELAGVVTLRVTGSHVCGAGCDWSDRILVYSLQPEGPDPDRIPASEAINLTKTDTAISQKFELPLNGHPIRYPFDSYAMRLGFVLQRVFPDGRVQTLTPAESAGHLFVTIHERLPRQVMAPPRLVNPQEARGPIDPYDYLFVTALDLERPLYLRSLTVVLVLLVAAAAAYAVFTRPFQDLIVNAGALILGVWAIRGILVPGSFNYFTAVDLSLALVIVFLLGALSVRAWSFFAGFLTTLERDIEG